MNETIAPVRTKRDRYVYRGAGTADAPPELAPILDRHRGHPDALMVALGEVQSQFGYLPQQLLGHLAHALSVPESRVFGVATFYNLFSFKPPGRHLVRVCRGTACHVNGSGGILSHLCAKLGLTDQGTTPDGAVTLETVACMGACSLAPVLVVDGQTHGRIALDSADQLVADLLAGDPTVQAAPEGKR
jgi:NADH-quinone oxidoreductase subunit E